MRCVNPECREEIKEGVKFCPHCSTNQPGAASKPKEKVASAGTGQTFVESEAQGIVSPGERRSFELDRTNAEPILLRASEKIWLAEDEEGRVEPGERRPLLVLDEQTVHLAHTDAVLPPEELLNNVKNIIETKGVPVEVQLCHARWIKDDTETRPRLVAALKNHRYSDVKMVMGLDYLGNWASFQMQFAHEPEPELPPPPVGGSSGLLIALGILLALGSAVSFFIMRGGSSQALGIFGFLIAIALIGFGIAAGQKHDREVREYERLKAERFQRTIDRLSRTFKIDDRRLFCQAMQQVFMAAVDGIVARGAELVRIEGGRGGYFQASGGERPPSVERQSDAGKMEV